MKENKFAHMSVLQFRNKSKKWNDVLIEPFRWKKDLEMLIKKMEKEDVEKYRIIKRRVLNDENRFKTKSTFK